MGRKISDCMLVICQKLHIFCTYNRPNFSGDRPPFGDPWPRKLQVLEQALGLWRGKGTFCPGIQLWYLRAGAESGSVDALSFETLIPKNIVERYVSLLVEHGRLMLCGPTGTGKTYLASRLAQHLVRRLVAIASAVVWQNVFSWKLTRSSTNLVLVVVMTCTTIRRHCDCFIASLAPFINIQTYLLTYLINRRKSTIVMAGCQDADNTILFYCCPMGFTSSIGFLILLFWCNYCSKSTIFETESKTNNMHVIQLKSCSPSVHTQIFRCRPHPCIKLDMRAKALCKPTAVGLHTGLLNCGSQRLDYTIVQTFI